MRIASKTIHSLLVIFPLIGLPLADGRPAFAQAISELPRAEYYAAKELFGAGRTADAMEGFQAALDRARRVGEQRWVDSIPPLVMLGDCYYQQGSLAIALEQYDAALMLVLANPAWIDQIELSLEPQPVLDATNGGIDWFRKSRPSQSVAVPEAVQIAIDPTLTQAGPQGNVVAPISLVTRLDATEVLRTLGVAMLRRWQIFGPLARHSPLAGPMVQYFNRTPGQQAAWLQGSWFVLRGISRLSTVARPEAAGLLRSGVLLANQFDYFMSPLALLALAELDANQGNYPAAILSLQDAALLAARFEQHAELATALGNLAAHAAASQRIDLLQPLQIAAVWCSNHSNLSFAAATTGAAELAIYADNMMLAEKLTQQAGSVLRSRDVNLPRLQAEAAYNLAMIGFAQNRSDVGVAQLDAALQLMRGTAQSGAVVESVFQAQLTLDFMASNNLTVRDGEAILNEVLAEPSAIQWLNSPLKTLTRITTASLPAYERHLELAISRGDTQQILLRMDRLQRQRFYEALPLGGRLLAWRHAVASLPGDLPADVRDVVERTFQRFPDLRISSSRIQTLVDELRQGPIPFDERLIPQEVIGKFNELTELSTKQENRLSVQALMRQPLRRYVPGTTNVDAIQQTLAAGDTLIAFAITGRSIQGVAIRHDQLEHWTIDDSGPIAERLNVLPVQIGLVRQRNLVLPSDVMKKDADWTITVKELYDDLFPVQIQQMVRAADRVILVPNGRLWYLPFELLPDPKDSSEPWLTYRTVTYVPTLGTLSKAFQAQPKLADTVGVVGNLFSPDSAVNQELAQNLVTAMPNSTAIAMSQRMNAPSADWLRMRSDVLWVASEVHNQHGGWESVILPIGKSRQSDLMSWLEAPKQVPKLVALPAFRTSLSTADIGNGNDLFLPACGMLVSGSQSALLSRWPVGGRTTAALMQRYLEGLPFERPSLALRRAILAQWPEEFFIADEPSLLPAGGESESLIPGKHPKLWAGYMAIGDTVSGSP